ncbi:MAG: caspase family protein [Saprospirales bacterium]|nr:caspase family protein [Saprospirales bacterium]
MIDDLTGPSGTNHLLAIAIDNYEYCQVLNNCVNDATGLIEVLKERYNFSEENIQTLFNEEATRPKIHEYLKGLKDRVKPEDSVVIYFSGHGETEDNVGYWIPVEAHPSAEWEFVSTNDIKSRLDSINSFHTFVIVDACFSGALFTSYRSVKAGNENKRSRLGLAASHTRERAFDGAAGENSPFSTHLLKMLWENTGLLSAHKLAAELIDEVYAVTKGKQTPVFKPLDVKGDDAGQYVFRLKADEGADWEACQRVGTLVNFEAFLAKYPEGQYAGEAQEKIALLRDQEAWEAAKSQQSISAYLQYRKDNPEGKYRDEALETIQQIEEDQSWQHAQRKKSIFEYENYLEKYPAGRYAQEAQASLQAILGGQAPAKQPTVQQPPKTTQVKEEKPLQKPKEEKSEPQKARPAEVKADKPASVPVGVSTTRQERPAQPSAVPATPMNRKYLMIGGGLLVVVVLVVWGALSGGGKSADPATMENNNIGAVDLSQPDGPTTASANQLQNNTPLEQPDKDPVKKTSEPIAAEKKPAPASTSTKSVTFDGKTYPVFRSKAGLTWMAQNIDYQTAGSWCYSGSNSNSQKYGRLYTWSGAKKACAAMGGGWRLPTGKELKSLAMQFGGADEDASDGGAAAFKAMTSGGFSAQLGGWRNAEGSFRHLGTSGYYWSSTENALGLIQVFNFSDGELSLIHNDPSLGFSCRCVK